MKKCIVFFLIFIVSLQVCNAQCIRLIAYADTNDAKLGTGFTANLNMLMQFEMALAAALDMQGACATPIVRRGTGCSKKQLQMDLSDFKCSPEDIVIFCYFGHGARSNGDESIFPQMCLGENNQANFVPIEDVKIVMQQKNPKFCIILGDCCNFADHSVFPKINVLTTAGASETRISQHQVDALKNLFLEQEGILLATGCKAGEFSWYDKNMGGFFFNSWLDALSTYIDAVHQSYNWNDIMITTQNSVLSLTQECKKRNSEMTLQHPQYIFEKRGANNRYTTKNEPVINSQDLRSSLVKLADDINLTPSQRIANKSQVKSTFFAPDAVVYVMGSDRSTILNQHNVDGYLRHVSTDFHLRNFCIIDEQKDANGKITSLKIHEIYVD